MEKVDEEIKPFLIHGKRIKDPRNLETAEDAPISVTPYNELRIRTRQPETSGELITSIRLGTGETTVFTAEDGAIYRNCSLYLNNNTSSDSNLTLYLRKRGATASADNALLSAKPISGNKSITLSGFDLLGSDIISGISSVDNAIVLFIFGDRVTN